MKRSSRASGAFGRSRLAVAAALVVTGSAAVAADLKSVDGILQFPNIRVIDSPQAAQGGAAPQGGMRAFKDSATSELRGPTTEEMASPTRPTAALSRRAAAADPSDAPVLSTESGAERVVLDESSLQYSVVVRQPDGSLAEVCVTGADKAAEYVRKQPVLKAAARQEILNDR